MLLLDDGLAESRKVISADSLAPLASSLLADLSPVLEGDFHLPTKKALLSRVGGRCEKDGTPLTFDPQSPSSHVCPRCNHLHRGEFHDRWWIYPYQLWLAERAVQAALLTVLRDNPECARAAKAILERYSHQYLQYPNRDNVLGPTRLFFSTYLESIWLLQICIAADLLSETYPATKDLVIDSIVQPSVELIASYNEQLSNRQVWNNAAMLAAALLTRDTETAATIAGPGGLGAHLEHGLLADGTWYEGENYHQFAHRGLWYCVTMSETAGIPIDRRLTTKFDDGFVAPLRTALPDFTLPSRKDSQYRVSLRQWRFADFFELGWTRTGDQRLAGALSTLYAPDFPSGDTGRARSTADVENNEAPVLLSRADLGWRSLLHAAPDLPATHASHNATESLVGQGITVFRRKYDDDEVYLALDWGQSGGGHGHPDRLNITLSHGAKRWLDDYGTGSYVDPSLRWYRSTLAHNAPMINGRSQPLLANGDLLAFEETDDMGWALGSFDANDTAHVERSIVVTNNYALEELRWTADEQVRLELPVHLEGDLVAGDWQDANCAEEFGTDDGFEFVQQCMVLENDPGNMLTIDASGDGKVMKATIWSNRALICYRLVGPSQPAQHLKPFFLIRAAGAGGTIRTVWDWSGERSDVSFSEDNTSISHGSTVALHRRKAEHWEMEKRSSNHEERIELRGWRERPPVSRRQTDGSPPQVRSVQKHVEYDFDLLEKHYVRSEATWEAAGRPSASVRMRISGDTLNLRITANTGEIVFLPNNAKNPFDNESPDINVDGVQVYVRTQATGGAWTIIPRKHSTQAHARRVPGWGDVGLLSAIWEPTALGFELDIAIPLIGQDLFALGLLVNETIQGRQRRRGQLALSGGRGEFVYLKGDRLDPRRLLHFRVID